MDVFPGASYRFSLWVGLFLFGVLVLAEVSAVKAQHPAPSAVAVETTPRTTPALQAAPERVQQAVQRAFHGADGVGKDGPMAKAGRDLIALYQQYEAGGPAAVNRLMGRSGQGKSGRSGGARGYSPVSPDGQFVTVDVVARENPSALLDHLQELGLEGGATAGNLVSGRLPIAKIKDAASLSSLRGMLLPQPRTHGNLEMVADSVIISEADTTHSAVEGRAALGVDGSGEKICALSDSYDNKGNASTNVSNGELPGSGNPHGNTADVHVLSDLSSGGSDEGRAMLQLIHDIADGAELGFHTAFVSRSDFASGIRELADAGCTVIVDDVGYARQPFYQDGVVSNAVDDVVNNDGVAYFSSAGNDGQNSYEAPFRNSGNSGVINSSAVRHDFDPAGGSVDTEQQITINDGATFEIWTFQWTDPTAEVSSTGPNTDLDIALVNQSGTIVAKKERDNISTGIPAEVGLEYTNNTGSQATYNLIIEKEDGPDPDQIKYIYQGSGFTIDDKYGEVGTATIYGHPMAAGAEAVAAAPFYYTSAYYSGSDLPYLENFSSKGGIKIRFDQSGSELGTYETRNKPDVTGTDGNDNTFFGSDIGFRDADSHPNFFGTSAAAPNVAAIAGLIREQNPGYTPSDVYSQLESNAKDVTKRLDSNNAPVSISSGDDRWSGHGFVQASAAALPVEMAGFDAEAEQNRAVLQWTTVSETNNSGFAVERRHENGTFETIGFVESKASGGTTTESTAYRFRTAELRVGTHTFRLRQVDLDGSTTYSRTVTVEVSLSGSHRVSTVAPNPVQKRGTISVAVSRAQQVRVAVYNVLGQRVAVLHNGVLPADDPAVMDVGEGLSSGTYLLRVTGESFAETRRFVRVR